MRSKKKLEKEGESESKWKQGSINKLVALERRIFKPFNRNSELAK